MDTSSTQNPTVAIDVSFRHYLEQRKSLQESRLIEGVPDYGFSLDIKLRQQLARIGPVRAVAGLLVSNLIQQYRSLHNLQSIAVGPDQLSDVHAIGESCARTLGIGIPQIFIAPASELNAYTIATDDAAPIIIITTALYDAMEPEELRFVIGHECGHIHNLHGVYNSALEVLTSPLNTLFKAGAGSAAIQAFRIVFQGSMEFLLRNWSRYAEVTCDRAGLICCGDLHASEAALTKLLTGGSGRLENLNVDVLLQQIEVSKSNPMGIGELFSTHPIIIKRILALRLFADSEVFHKWRPDKHTKPYIHGRIEADNLCEQVIGVIKKWPWQKR